MITNENKGFVVYPSGDFDGNAVVIDAPSAKAAAYQYFFDVLDAGGDPSETICVLPFESVREFTIQAVETTQGVLRGSDRRTKL